MKFNRSHSFFLFYNSIVNVGTSFNESEEDVLRSTQIQEQTITEITPDGRIIEKKIVTYPGEETTEIEEIEEVDGQTISVKRSVIGSDNKEVKSEPKPLAEIKNEPVVLVPGCRTVEIDEKTNSTIVTEKTTTGYQQTTTIIQEDGTKKTQTKIFFDPVEIPGQEEEEETYEETETFEPGSKKTTVRTITGAKDAVEGVETSEVQNLVKQDERTTVVQSDEPSQQTINEKGTNEKKVSEVLSDLKNQPVVIVPGHQKIEFNNETNTTTVTDKTTTGYQQTISTVTTDGRTIVETKVFYDPIPAEQVEEKTTTTTITEASQSGKNTSEVQQTEVKQDTEVEQIKQQVESQIAKGESGTTTTTSDVKDLQLVPAGSGPTSLTQKKTTAEGKEVEVTTTVSEDGKTKTVRKTVRQPSEEMEIEEHEETHSYEPGEVKVVTTTITIPLVEDLEEAATDIVDTAKAIVEAIKTKVDPTKNTDVISKQAKPSQLEITAKGASTPSGTTAIKEQTEVKSQTNVSAKQTATQQVTSEAKQTTTSTKTTTTAAKQTTPAAKQTTTTSKQTTTETKQTTTTAKQPATEAKQTTTAAKQTTSEAKPTTIADTKPTKKETKQDKTEVDASTKKLTSSKTSEKETGKATTASKKDDSQTKSKTTAAAKNESALKSDNKTSTKTSTSTTVATIDKPKVTTKNGETTTEVVRRVAGGGTEHVWTTVRADGTTKVESKTYFDTVEVEDSGSEEEYEEEYEEVIEEETPPVKTVTTKTQAPGAVGTKGKNNKS